MKQSNTKKSLTLSAWALFISIVMLIGTTFAWFTDSVTSGKNKIKAGNLDVDLVMDKNENDNYVSIADEDGAIFGGENSLYAQDKSSDTLWEPGKTQIVYLGVQNKGSLALKYNIVLKVTDGGLASALEYAIIDGAKAEDLTEVTKWSDLTGNENVQMGNVQGGTFVAAENGVLEEIAEGTQDETDYFALAVHMKEEAGNEYMNKDITIDVTVVATQKDAESDSFNNQYDKGATLNIPFDPVTGEVTSDMTIEKQGIVEEATVPKDVVNNVFNMMKDESAESNTMTLYLNVENKGSTSTSINLDIGMTAIMKSTKDGVTSTKEKTVNNLNSLVEVKLKIDKNKLNLQVKHNGKDMTSVENKDAISGVTPPNLNGYYNYNNSTGDLILWVNSFSPFTVSFENLKSDAELLDENPNYTCRIGNKGYFRPFGENVNGKKESALKDAVSGDTIKMIADYTSTDDYFAHQKVNDCIVNIDLNSKKITMKNTFQPAQGIYNIIDTSEEKAGSINKVALYNYQQDHYNTTLNVYSGNIDKISTAVPGSYNVNIHGGRIGYIELQDKAKGVVCNIVGGSVQYVSVWNDMDVGHYVFCGSDYSIGEEVQGIEKVPYCTNSYRLYKINTP